MTNNESCGLVGFSIVKGGDCVCPDDLKLNFQSVDSVDYICFKRIISKFFKKTYISTKLISTWLLQKLNEFQYLKDYWNKFECQPVKSDNNIILIDFRLIDFNNKNPNINIDNTRTRRLALQLILFTPHLRKEFIKQLDIWMNDYNIATSNRDKLLFSKESKALKSQEHEMLLKKLKPQSKGRRLSAKHSSSMEPILEEKEDEDDEESVECNDKFELHSNHQANDIETVHKKDNKFIQYIRNIPISNHDVKVGVKFPLTDLEFPKLEVFTSRKEFQDQKIQTQTQNRDQSNLSILIRQHKINKEKEKTPTLSLPSVVYATTSTNEICTFVDGPKRCIRQRQLNSSNLLCPLHHDLFANGKLISRPIAE